MAITIGSSTITGVTTNGIPAGSVTGTNIASGAVTAAKINATGRVVQTQFLSSGTRTTIAPGNTLTEASSNYRVNITPQFSNSMIIVHYMIPMSWGTDWAVNYICRIDARRWTGGSQFAVSSIGAATGSRIQIAGYSERSYNGHDINDQNMWCFTAIDFPGSTSTHQYGFRASTEGGTLYWGYSRSDNSSWGFDANIQIIAQEIKQ
jgi:hypothetical protein